MKDTAGHAVGTVSAELTTKLQDFVTAAAVSDMYEVEAAKIAEQRSRDPGGQGFAAKMISRAHATIVEELKATLTKINATATPPGARRPPQGMIDEFWCGRQGRRFRQPLHGTAGRCP